MSSTDISFAYFLIVTVNLVGHLLELILYEIFTITGRSIRISHNLLMTIGVTICVVIGGAVINHSDLLYLKVLRSYHLLSSCWRLRLGCQSDKV